MKYKWKQVLFWFALFHFVGEPLQDFMVSGDTSSFMDLSSFKSTMITISMFLSLSMYALLAYTTMYHFYAQKKWFLLVLGFVLSIVLPISLRALIEQKLYDVLFGFTNYFGHTPWTYFRDNLYFTFKSLAVGIGYFLVSYSLYREKTTRSLELENQKMQLSVLKSQVNPHFLLNSLNNIYSLVYQKSAKSLEALDRLSDLLKYNLYSNKDTVLLAEELDYLDKYIDLQSLRYNYPIEIRKNIAPEAIGLNIPQLLLLPLIENAFKHGDLRGEPITMDINLVDKKLKINVSSKIGKIEKDETSGVGLDNVKSRLHLYYDGKATLKTEERDGFFIVHIEIPVT